MTFYTTPLLYPRPQLWLQPGGLREGDNQGRIFILLITKQRGQISDERTAYLETDSDSKVPSIK